MPREFYEQNVNWFNNNYTTESLPEEDIDDLIKQGIKFIDDENKKQNNEQYQKYLQVDVSENEELSHVAYWMVKFFVTELEIINRHVIFSKFGQWVKEHELDLKPREITAIIDSVWKDYDIFTKIKQIAFNLGHNKKTILLASGQAIEAGEYLKALFHIKKIELGGRLIWFNGKCYSLTFAEELIRRESRKCFLDCKNKDIGEVVGYITDSAEIISQQTIEEYTHLICCPNGVYNIKTGEFTTKFNPDNVIIRQLLHDYDETQDFVECKKTIENILPDEQERSIFYDFGSCCLHPYNGMCYQTGVINDPGSGKTQLGLWLELVLGSDNVSHTAIHKIACDPTTQIKVTESLLDIDDDVSEADLKQIDILKRWNDQSKFTDREIFAKPVTFRPMARLLFFGNKIYEIPNDKDAQAIYDRTQLLKGTPKKFRHSKDEVKDIIRKQATKEELSGALTFLLKNATEIWDRQNYSQPLTTQEVESIWMDYGNKVRQFICKYLIREKDSKVGKGELLEHWKMFAYQNQFAEGTYFSFYRKIEQITGEKTIHTRGPKGKQFYAYPNYRLKTSEELEREGIATLFD